MWSREHGYPGDYAFLEFHKKHFPGGLRFWRITDHQGDLGTKAVYDPDIAAQKVGLQAAHFVDLVVDTLARAGKGPSVVCSPYDAELFGHWWFEGPLWLEHVAREMERRKVPRMTLGESLESVPARTTVLAPGGLVGRRRRPSGVAQPRHRVDLGPHLQRRSRVGRPSRPARRPPRAPPR